MKDKLVAEDYGHWKHYKNDTIKGNDTARFSSQPILPYFQITYSL